MKAPRDSQNSSPHSVDQLVLLFLWTIILISTNGAYKHWHRVMGSRKNLAATRWYCVSMSVIRQGMLSIDLMLPFSKKCLPYRTQDLVSWARGCCVPPIKKRGEEARGFTTVRGAPQNGDGRTCVRQAGPQEILCNAMRVSDLGSLFVFFEGFG